MNKQQLAAKIWESANRMRSKIEANEYKDYILGFIFYKFLSETELAFLRENDFSQADIEAVSEEDPETVNYIKENIGFFIAYDGLFSTWLSKGKDFTVDDVRVALSSFSRNINAAHTKVFDGIFETLETGLSKLGDSSSSQTKAIRDLLDTIKDIPMDDRQGYDVLGFVYEYLISNFAANAGKKAGEFYTPHEVSQLMSEIVAHHLGEKSQISIYDPTSGSGSLLINIGKAVSRRVGTSDSIKYYAQELKANTYNLTRMNLVMRGILPDNIAVRNADTLEDDWPYLDNPLYVDAVVSNPPYSQRWDPTNKDIDVRYQYGIAPKSKADYAFLLHDLYHLRPEGIMCIVLPHGVLFRGGEEGRIRRNLLENRHIQAIIGLPANIFFGTGIPTIIMVLRQKREESDVLIIDASKGFEKSGKNNRLRACDIKRIADTVAQRKSIPKFSRVVELDEIRNNDYNLNIPRYVDSSEDQQGWDLYASMFGGVPAAEVDALQDYWQAWPSLKGELFSGNGEYLQLSAQNPKDVIFANTDTQAFRKEVEQRVAPLTSWLESYLLTDPCSVDGARAEQVVCDKLFDSLDGVVLLDRYAAYQKLDEAWTACIGTDLEILQTEGMGAATAVDPNLVLKKKNGKDHEVQDGWVGRVIPFELAQTSLLASEKEALAALEAELASAGSELESSVEDLTEDEKTYLSDALNDDNTAWVNSAVAKLAKSLAQDSKSDSEVVSAAEKANKAAALIKRQKELKAQIKKDSASLHEQTKVVIESLDAAQVHELLKQKWIEPLANDLYAMPDACMDELAKKVQALGEKYNTTFAQVTDEIAEAERELSAMIDDLVGNEFDMAGLAELKKLLGGE